MNLSSNCSASGRGSFPQGRYETYTGALIQQIKFPLFALALVLFGSVAGQAQTSLAFTTNGTLPSGQVQVGYSTTITVVGGQGLRFFTLTGGGLPAGLSTETDNVPGNNLRIVGTPTTVGVSTFTINVTSGGQSVSQEFSITINSNQLAVASTSLPNAVLNQSYSQSVQATGDSTLYVYAARRHSASWLELQQWSGVGDTDTAGRIYDHGSSD